MIVLNILPIIISTLLIAAHFYRSNSLVLTAVCILFPLILISKKHWIPWALTGFLLLSAAEWVRTLLFFIERYQQADLPWTRLAVILGGVCLFTALSSLSFKTGYLKRRYS